MITTIAVYAGGILGACTIAIVAIIINADREQPTTDQASTALVKREHAPTQPVFVGMPAQRQPSALEKAIDLYVEHGLEACVTYVHAHDDQANGWS